MLSSIDVSGATLAVTGPSSEEKLRQVQDNGATPIRSLVELV
jgi:hypothetical protein